MKRPEQPSIPGIDTPGAPARGKVRRTRQKRAGEPEAAPGHKETVAAFNAAYVKAYGARPTWGPKQGAMMKRLLAQHGPEEVQRRIELLFGGAIDWPRPPYDLGVLVSQFDRLVAPTVAKPGRVRPSDVLGKVRP